MTEGMNGGGGGVHEDTPAARMAAAIFALTCSAVGCGGNNGSGGAGAAAVVAVAAGTRVRSRGGVGEEGEVLLVLLLSTR